MRRFQLIELHEQPWFPAPWREMFQEGLGKTLPLLGAYQNLTTPLSFFLHRTRTNAILDLCSGSAEPIVQLRENLGEPLDESARKLVVFLSDLYPNLAEFRRLKTRFPGIIDFFPEPVDALSPPAEAPRVRTMLNAFHHFEPDRAKAILRDAAHNADGIAIVESTGRTWRNMLFMLPLPLVAIFVLTFLLRPFRWRNLLWGFLIPVVPLTAFIDGIISNLRTYTPDELEAFTREVGANDFQWEIGSADMPRSGLRVTYLFGWRKTDEEQAGEPLIPLQEEAYCAATTSGSPSHSSSRHLGGEKKALHATAGG